MPACFDDNVRVSDWLELEKERHFMPEHALLAPTCRVLALPLRTSHCQSENIVLATDMVRCT